MWLDGEHDLSSSGALVATIEMTIGVDDRDVVVDMSKTDFIDALTIGVLIGAWNRLRQSSRTLVVRAPTDCARRVLSLCDLTGLIDAPPPHQPRLQTT